MVVVPAGSFTMGSPEGEGDRTGDESPQHVVTIGKPFAVGKLHVTVDQFAAFVQKTGYRASSTCWTLEDGKQEIRTNRSWRSPGFAQEGSHPVVCVSWNDAKAYGDWLAKETGKPYRLLTESEWEYAARGRTSPGAYPRFWFGDDIKALCRYGNGADQKARDSLEGTSGWTFAPCNDGYVYTSPAGHYQANAFDLYDMAGNAWQWTADCYHDSYKGAPADGSAWTPGTCSEGRLVRGGAWYHIGGGLRAANRFKPSTVYNFIGFRLARTLTP
jgi:formylglycine-generating enzyme required for sulfatase activity